jgi:hypothetical protein
MRFDPKISTLEERAYLDSISMDELHGIFTAYEMKTEQENPGIVPPRESQHNNNSHRQNLNREYG